MIAARGLTAATMSMVGSPDDGLDQAASHRSDSAPAPTGAVLLLIDELRHTVKALVSLASPCCTFAAVTLMQVADEVSAGSGALSLTMPLQIGPRPLPLS